MITALGVLVIAIISARLERKAALNTPEAELERLRKWSRDGLAVAMKLERSEERKRRVRQFLWRWYVRYTAAGLLVVGIWSAVEASAEWWQITALAVPAAILAWEATAAVVVIAGIWWLASKATTISIPAAIIIGACIIAYAIDTKRR